MRSKDTLEDETPDLPVAKFCDRSPCPGMLTALGRWILGNEKGGFTALTAGTLPEMYAQADEIFYCPFCGTRLTQLELKAGAIVEL